MRDDLLVILCLPDDADCPVDVQEDFREAFEKVQLFLLLPKVEGELPLYALPPPPDPFIEDPRHAEHDGAAVYEDGHVEGVCILGLCQPEKLLHEKVRVRAALVVDGDLEALQVRLVPYVADLVYLSRLDGSDHAVYDRFRRGGEGDLADLDDAVLFIGLIDAAHLKGPFPCPVAPGHLFPVVEDLRPCRKVRRGHNVHYVLFRLFDPHDGGVTEFRKVEGWDARSHADGDALRGVRQYAREGDGQEHRLLPCSVVVVHELDRVFADPLEEFGRRGREARFRVTAGGIGHVPRVVLPEITLAVHEGREQCLVVLGHAHHGLVVPGVAVGVQEHGPRGDVRGLCPVPGRKAHLVHGVQELPVGRLEPVDLRERARYDDAHGVRHEVLFKRL